MFSIKDAVKSSRVEVEERRRFRRFDCCLSITYATEGLNYIQSQTTADNVSLGGIRIKVARPIKTHDSLKFSICQPRTGQSIYAKGKVRWVREDVTSRGVVRIAGIEFVDVEPFGIERIIPSCR